MGSSNPLILYYDIILAISVVLTAVYVFKWQKHFDVHITIIFVMVPVINLGYALLAHAAEVEEALAINKFIYLGGCFLGLIILLAVCTLCEVRIHRALKSLFFLLSIAVYFSALSVGYNDWFYRNVSLSTVSGISVLTKEYGWMHTVFMYMVLCYFLGVLAVIAYCFFRKNQISRKILALLFLPEMISMVSFFGGRKVTGTVELMPAAYLAAQIVYMIIVSRVALYDVTDTAIDSMVQSGKTGFISIDYGYHYLGSNERARKVFPELRDMTVDLSVKRSRAFGEFFIPLLETYKEDRHKHTAHYEKDDRIYRINIAPLFSGRREKGYQVTVTDDTADQRFIRLMNRYNDQLQDEVAEKTAHIEEMHDKLILGMATMVESRDNSTGGHIRRTSEGVRLLLKETSTEMFPELTDSFRRNLIKAAPMHDLGKIAVDDEVLRKPGRFTPEEFEKMKSHAAAGSGIVHEILKGTDDDEFHLIAENVAHYHHERWDGSGYPEKLKGEEIPLEARIMAVADVYDALVSRRAYKDKMSFEEANRIMMEGMGTQFAPEMKEVYCQARPKLEAYYSSLE